ncbi:MAG: flavodoxin family protein [Desulfobacterales bacterium]|jgi:multimeric flavodoxin WrbA|nr:MAG: flavodoxin family protein [Desulfobacterales bacterium]
MADTIEPRKILVLFSSPRKKGNSAALANQIIKGSASEGANVEAVFLNGMNISPCQACYACQKKDSKGCAIDDDMQSIYPKLVEYDTWVIASPVYWFTMSAQAKLFMDRCFALLAYANNPFAGKRIAIAMSYGDTDPFNSGCVNALRAFQDSFNYVGANIIGMVYGSANEAGEITSNANLMQQAESLGKKLASR